MSAALVALLLTAAPAARNFTLDAPASSIRYHVVHKLHRVDGSSSSLEGKAVLQPDGRVLAMVRAPVATFDSGDGNREKLIRLTSAPGRSSVSAPPLARGGDVEIHLPHPLRKATLGGRPATAAYDAPTRRLRVPFPAGQELRLVVEY